MARLAPRPLVVGALAVLAALLPFAVAPASAAVDPLPAARAFLVGKQQADGGFEVGHFPSFETPDAVLALAELAQTGSTWSPAAARAAVLAVSKGGKTPLDYVDDQVEAADLAPAVAAKYLTLVVRPLGLNPHDVDPSNDSPKPVDLVAAMGKGAGLDGRYTTTGNAFNGLLFIALAHWSLDCAVPTDLVSRIKAAQQANGSWDFSGASTGTGVDVDTTGLAVIALTRAGRTTSDPSIKKALTLLAQQHRANGSWQASAIPPPVDDPNSTSVATLAVAATGQNPTTATWRDAAAPALAGQPYVSPVTWLRSQQRPDGHIAGPGDSFGVTTFSTSQTIEALTRHWFTSKPASTVACPLPGGDRGAFLRSEFRTLAHRAGSNAELQGASVALGVDPNVRPKRLAAVRSTLSTDAYRRVAVVQLYAQALARRPDGASLTFWANQLRSLSRQSVLASLLGSHEFFARSGGTASGFLEDVYVAAIGRAPDAGGRAFWLRHLAAGTTRRAVAVSLVTSAEGRRLEVTARYHDLLGRRPTASELAYWSERLAGEPVERLIATLVSSAEYFERATA